MTIEALLTRNNEILERIAVAIESQKIAATELSADTATGDKKAKTKKAETPAASPAPAAPAAPAEEKNEQAASAAPATTAPATASTEPSATAQAATASAPASAAVEWKTVLDKMVSIAKSEDPKQGKAAVRKVIDHFKPGAMKVPELEALNKNAEILAFADELIGAGAEDNDLGI